MQLPFCVTPLRFEHLMHKPSFSVMGKVDMFSRLHTLLLRVKEFLDERWDQSTEFFERVNRNLQIGLRFLKFDFRWDFV